MKHWTRCGYHKIVACKNTLHGAKHMVVGTGMAASWFQFKSIFLPCRFERASNKDTEYPYTLVPLFCLVTQQNLSLKKNCFVGTQKNIDIKRPTLWSAWFSFVWGKTVLKKWAHESFCTHWSDRGTRDAMKLDNCSKSAASSRIAGVSCGGCCVAAQIQENNINAKIRRNLKWACGMMLNARVSKCSQKNTSHHGVIKLQD